MHAASQKKYADKPITTNRKMSKTSMMGLIDNLESGIRKLKWSSEGSDWSNYYSDHNYSSAGLRHKEQIINDYIERIKPSSLWDLGANIGRFSRLSSSKGIPTIAFDIDPGAVELNYLHCVSQREKNILPLLQDLTNPSPSLGWNNKEREGLIDRGPADAVMALALIHHLLISNNVPIQQLAKFFYRICHWLIIEFIPKDDSQVQRLLASREDIFTQYTLEQFETLFQNYFEIIQTQEIEDSQRRIYLMERRQLENYQ
jgi:ribosomal protein L11 methylase PrmA